MSVQSGIYTIQNVVNNKLYIGSTLDLAQRKRTHFSELRRNCHKNPHLQNAFNKYGEQVFIFRIIELCDRDELLAREQFYMDQHDITNSGYNINPDAKSNLGMKWSQDVRMKMSKAKLGRKLGNHSKEWNRKISESLMGRKYSIERRNNIALARGKPFRCLENGVVYVNQAEAARQLGIKHRSLNAVLNGHRKSTGGLHFEFC